MSNSSLQPILALLGHPLGGNPTQYMIEKAFAYHQLDWRYLSLEVAPEDLADAVRGMRVMGFRGGNCAEPHKHAILEHLDRRERSAELAGTVNCILREDTELVGRNTEGQAVLEAVGRRTDPAGKRVVLLGAGGVARAIGVELALAGAAEIVVVNRSEEPARRLADLISGELQVPASTVVWDDCYELPEGTDLVINATSICSGDDDAPLPLELGGLAEQTVVVDVTTDPPETWLVRQASQRGCHTVDGLEIFITQSAINFRLWTDVDADTTVMSEAAEEFLGL